VRIEHQHEVVRFTRDGGRVTGVVTARGAFEAPVAELIVHGEARTWTLRRSTSPASPAGSRRPRC